MSYGQQAAAKCRETEVDSLKKIARELNEADRISDGVVQKLHGQTEQLERTQHHAAMVDHNLDQSAYLLRGLKGPFGWVINIFGGAPSSPAPVHTANAARPSASGGQRTASGYLAPAMSGAERIKADAARRATTPAGSVGAGPGVASSPASRGAQSETDPLYEQIDGVLGNLKQKTKDINRTLVHHNDILARLDPHVDDLGARVTQQRNSLQSAM